MQESKEELLLKKLHLAQENNNKNEKIIALLNLSEFYLKNKEYESSHRALNDIIIIDSKYPDVYYYLAITSVYLNDIKNALKFAQKELENYPNNSNVREFREQLKEKTRFPVLTLTIIILNIIIYFLFVHPLSFVNLALFSSSNFSTNLTSTITSLFFHVNIIHLIVNTLVLAIFGFRLEKNIGAFNFLIIFLVSGIIGNATQALLIPNSFVIGASAGLFGLMGTLLMREPLLDFYFLGIARVPVILFFGGFFSFLFLFSKFFILGESATEIAHLIGLLTGMFICAIIYSQTRNIFYNWLIIAMGFWAMMYFITDLFFYSHFSGVPVMIDISIIFIAFLMIAYSYGLLKMLKTIKGVQPK